MRSGEGLHRFVDPVDGSVYLYTQFETFDAHRMYACFDQPDLKATFRLTVQAPGDWVVVSNGAVEQRPAEGPDGKVLPGTWTFAETPRMSTYITALVAGPYASVHDEHDGIPLGIFCRRSLVQHLDPDDLFTVTKQGFDYFHRVFGYRYPFGKYDQLFVPEFNAGAMENAGAVTFLEDYVFRSKVTDAAYERRAETVLHEMAHMWFGDLVTMRWWDDLWLNESFATYMSVLAQVESTRYTRGWTTFASTEKTWAYRQDQLPSTHPIAADIVDIEAVKVNFDGITYAKGASVLKQLVAWVGQDAFLSALRTYFTDHAYGNTVLADLLGALERASGRDLSDWSAEWLETAGVNTLRPVFETDGDGVFTSFTVVQEAPEQWPTLRSHRVAIGCYDLVDGTLRRTAREELDVVGAKTEVPGLVGKRQPDLVLVNDDDLTYAKIRLDERSLATLVEHVGDFEESLPRTLCWTAAWDMTRDAEMPARDYVATVLAGIGGETDIGVVQSLLRQVQAALTQFASPAWAPTGRAQVADAALAAVRAAEPGSDLQLAWARALGSVARERGAAGAAARAARRHRRGARPVGRHRPALAPAAAPGRARRRGRRRDRRRARARPDVRRRAPRRDGPGAAPDPRGQGRGLAPGRRGRVDPERRARRRHRRVRAPRAARAARGVGRPVLRRRGPGLGDAHRRVRPEHRRRALPGAARRPVRRRAHRRLPGLARRPARARPAAARGPRRGGARAAGPGARHRRGLTRGPVHAGQGPRASGGPWRRGRRGSRAACRRGAP